MREGGEVSARVIVHTYALHDLSTRKGCGVNTMAAEEGFQAAWQADHTGAI